MSCSVSLMGICSMVIDMIVKLLLCEFNVGLLKPFRMFDIWRN